MEFKDTCELCDNTGVYAKANGPDDFEMDYCMCEFGWEKEYAEMKGSLKSHFTTF